jgi:RNA polymerase sigma factor (sigma-70 family)
MESWMQAAEHGIVTLPERFETFYRREFRSVVGLAYALSGSRWAAEDLAQEAFIAAHKKWDRIGEYESPAAWVRRVVANMAVSLYRRRASEARAMARIAVRRQEALPALDAEDDEFWAEVRALPKRQAQAIALHYLEDRPVAEVADILDCSPSTAKVHLHKGRLRLAERLGTTLGESS